jgi:outer membrane lipoprotein-sorting protein
MKILLTAFIVLLCLTVPQAHAQNDCKLLFDADDKMLSTDHHAYVTTPGGKETHEMVMVGGVSYIQFDGAWRKSPMTAAQMREQKIQNRKNAKNLSCHFVREELVDGESARVYSSHSEDEDTKSDATIWISKSKGVTLKIEQDSVSTGSSKTHQSVRYTYTNITAPPVH